MSGDGAEPVPASALDRASEIIPDRLYFLSLRGHPRSDAQHYFWTADHDLTYEPFEADFGPLNMSMLVKFCRSAYRNLTNPNLQRTKLYFYSSHDGHKRANAGYLIAAFAVIVLDFTPDDAWALIAGGYPPFLPYRDVSCGVSTYNCTILHCLQGIHRAKELGWVDWKRFDCDEYEYYEQPQNGDFNWIIPPSVKGEKGRLVAFAAPHAATDESMMGFRYWAPEDYCKVFRERGITGIVRLCRKTYDRKSFTEAGFKHIDLIYPDGSTPTDCILTQFMDFMEANPGGVAVHCKAGLGRTGTLIGCYLIKNCGFSAESAIAWMRVCRPGCVIGQQQQFLQELYPRLRRHAIGTRVVVPHKVIPLAPPSPQKKVPGAAASQRSLKSSTAADKANASFHAGSTVGAKSQAVMSNASFTSGVPGGLSGTTTLSLLQRSRQMQDEIDVIIQESRASHLPWQSTADTAPQRTPATTRATTPEKSVTDGLMGRETLMKQMDVISKKDIVELRSFAFPPQPVLKTVFCFLKLLGLAPAELNWVSATRRLNVDDVSDAMPRAVEDAVEDPRRTLKLIEQYCRDPQCTIASVSGASLNAQGMAEIIHGFANYCKLAMKSMATPLPPLTNPNHTRGSCSPSSPAPSVAANAKPPPAIKPRKPPAPQLYTRMTRPPASLIFDTPALQQRKPMLTN